jgi:ketol-acid reductoisomerase
MPLRRYSSKEARVDLLAGKTVAVLGYGSQGEAHAQNLRDSGVRVIVAQRPGGPRYAAALAAGFDPTKPAAAVRSADLLIFGWPDETVPALYAEHVRPYLRAGQALGFMHGFVVTYRQIDLPPDVDVILVAPKAQGRGVRSEYLAGRGVFALVAVEQDATGRALETALGWAAGIGAGRAGIFQTTFREETETDLFGEQAVLCGGLSALIRAGFETLVEAGYPPELAYFECCHEIKLLADLVHEGGITYMRERVSNAARYGDLTRGPRVIGPAVREAMRQVLAEIRSGEFADELASEAVGGYRRFRQLTERDRAHPLERVGQELRALPRPQE